MGIEWSCNQNRYHNMILDLASNHRNIAIRFRREVPKIAEELMGDSSRDAVERAKAFVAFYPMVEAMEKRAQEVYDAAFSRCEKVRHDLWEDAPSDKVARQHYEGECDCAEESVFNFKNVHYEELV